MSNNYEMIPVVVERAELDDYIFAVGGGAFVCVSVIVGTILIGEALLWPELLTDPTYWGKNYIVEIVLFAALLGAIIGMVRFRLREKRKSKDPFMYKGKVITRGKWKPPNLRSGYYVYKAICRAFTRTDARFSGSIQQFVDIGAKTEQYILRGFSILVDLGLITTEGDTFTPTDLFLKYLPSS